MADLTTVGSVAFRIQKEANRWLKVPDTAIDPLTFHYAPDLIKQASVTLIKYRLLCTRSNVSLHTTCCPCQLDYMSKA